MKASLKNLNAYIQDKYPNLDIEFVKGKGYFYFMGDDGFDSVESIYVCALNQMSYEEWCRTIDWRIEERQIPEPYVAPKDGFVMSFAKKRVY